MSRDWNAVRHFVNDLEFFNRDLIDLVEDVDARGVDTVTLNRASLKCETLLRVNTIPKRSYYFS